jgi:hypothetical protein
MSKLIEFATAKLASEKGFDITPDFVYDLSEESKSIKQYGETFGDDELYAPTQSELQRWLREKHKLHCCVCPYEDEDGAVLFEGTTVEELDSFSIYPLNGYDTYEQALEEVLFQSLEFIDTPIDFSQVTDIEFSDVDHKDHPDYVDAFIESALYKGFPASEKELDLINADSQFVHDSLMNQMN